MLRLAESFQRSASALEVSGTVHSNLVMGAGVASFKGLRFDTLESIALLTLLFAFRRHLNKKPQRQWLGALFSVLHPLFRFARKTYSNVSTIPCILRSDN
jgi:hypothetical protein